MRLKLLARTLVSRKRVFDEDERGFVSLGPVLTIVGVVLGTIVAVLVLAALAPTFFTAVADITGALTNADLNNTLANTIAGIVAIVVPLALLFGFVALIFKVKDRMG